MNISDYLMTVTGAAFSAIAADIVSEAFMKGKNGLEKYIRFGITVCVASCMLLPLTGTFDIIKDSLGNMEYALESGYDDSEENTMYILEKECEEKLSEIIYSETGIKPVCISIKITTEDGNPDKVQAAVTLALCDADKSEEIKRISDAALGTCVSVRIADDGDNADYGYTAGENQK